MTRHNEEMSISKFAICGCLAAAVLLTWACGPATPPDTRAADESTIKDQDVQWSKAAAAKDVDGTVSYYSDDASLLPPNAPLATGAHAIRAIWASLLGPDGSLSWQANKVEVARSGDLAYVLGVYQMTQKNAQQKTAADHGKFVEVWKKQADGKWKAVADMFNSDLPIAAAAPLEKKAHHAKASHSGKHH
jgi:ketosteroid isomerase-like protein